MSIEESIQLYEREYPKLSDEETKLVDQLVTIFQKKLKEIQPIVDLMKDKRFFFYHPDLRDEIRTTHGVILGRNLKNNAEIYVYSGNLHFLDKVDGYNDSVVKQYSISLANFLSICDLEFAMNGIEHIRNFLTTVLAMRKKSIEEKKRFIELHNDV